MTRLRLVDWPLLRRPLAAALAVATALSLGDLGVAAFFGTGNILTLPLLLYQRMSRSFGTSVRQLGSTARRKRKNPPPKQPAFRARISVSASTLACSR